MTLLGLVMLIAVAAVAFVDYEMVRADADAARFDAEVARANCFGTVAPTIAERKRRNARCERIPDPVGVSKRIERRWEQRRPWYGFAAGAIFSRPLSCASLPDGVAGRPRPATPQGVVLGEW